MRIWSVCAAIGLALTLATASSCNSDKKGGTSSPDGSTGRDVSIRRDSASGELCVYRDQTYQPGESFTYNCVRFRCEGGNNIVQTGGAPCTDGGPDLRAGGDVPFARDVGRADAADASRDVAPVETARQDVRAPVDAQGIDVEPRADTAPREDTAPPRTDTAVPEADTAPPAVDVAREDLPPPLQCTYDGQKYGVGVTFQCACNTCKCDSTGTVVLVTNNDCTIDAG